MGEAWVTGIALAGLLVSFAAFLLPHRRALRAEREAAASKERSAAGQASLVTASVHRLDGATTEVVITNGAPTPIADVDLLDVRMEGVEPRSGWRLDPEVARNDRTACVLQPLQSLRSHVQLLDSTGLPVQPAPDTALVISFGFRDADGQWWERDIGRPPQPRDHRPAP